MNKQEKQLQKSLAGSARIIRSKMENKMFFTSGLLARRFSDKACAITGRYGEKSRVRVYIFWEPLNDRIGFAEDNSSIYLNIGHVYFDRLVQKNEDEVVQKLMNELSGFCEKQVREAVVPWLSPIKKETRYELLNGLFGHEMGHILYTNATEVRNWLKSFQRAKLWYPVNIVNDDAADRRQILEKHILQDTGGQFRRLFILYAKKLMNCVEDGYIETRIIQEYPGILGYCVQKLRMFSVAAEISMQDTYQAFEVGRRSSYQTIAIAILKYATTQTIYWGNVPQTASERIRFEEIRPWLDQVLRSHTTVDRLALFNQILIRLANELVEQILKDIQNGANQRSIEERLEELFGPMDGDAKGRGNAVCQVIHKEQIGGNSVPESEKGTSHTASEEDISQSTPYDMISQRKGEERVTECSCPDDGQDTNFQEENNPHETGDDLYDEQKIKIKQEVYDLFNEVSLDQAAQAEDKARMEWLSKQLKEIDWGSANRDLSVKLIRPDPVDISLYNLVADPLKTVAKKMERSLLSKVCEKRNMQKVNGLYMGRKLEAGNIVRNDGRLFSRKRQPAEGVEMAVGVLIDESGSMRGNKYDAAKKMAILLYEFCRGLDFPVMIYGHNALHRETTLLYAYVEFESVDGNDSYRVLQSNCGGSNRDGAALRYMVERLSERPEQIKVLIIISDGQPSAYPSHTEGIDDVRNALALAKKRSIVLIAAGLEESADELSTLYQDHFLDISNMETLPVTLISMLKRYMERVL